MRMDWGKRAARARVVRALLAAMLALPAVSTASAGRLPVRRFTSVDGLDQDEVQRVVVDRRGFLWVCTRHGLSLFDGERFTSFGEPDGLEGRTVHDVAIDARGVGWVGTERGLYRFEPGRVSPPGALFARVPFGSEDDPEEAYRIAVGADGAVWIGTMRGLYLVEPTEGSPRALPFPLGPEGPPARSSRVQSVAVAPGGELWVGTHACGIFRVSMDRHVDAIPPAEAGAAFVRGFAFDADGRVWTAFIGGVARLAADPFAPGRASDLVFRVTEGLPSGDTGRMAFLGPDRLIVATTAGVAELRRSELGTWSVAGTLDRRGGLPEDAVKDVAVDAAGDVWIGLATRGLVRRADHGFTVYDEVERSGSQIVALVDDGAGGVAALSREGRGGMTVWHLEDGGFRAHPVKLPPFDALTWGLGQGIAWGRSGRAWLATAAGLFRWEDATHEGAARLERPPSAHYLPEDGLPSPDVLCVHEDARGRVFVGSSAGASESSGLSVLVPGSRRFESIPREAMGDHRVPIRIVEDRAGRVWVLMGDGAIVREIHGGFRDVEIPPAFREGLNSPWFDHEGRLWLLGEGALISRDPGSDTPHFETYAVSREVASASLRCAVEDRNGEIWFGTDRGVLRLQPGTGRTQRYTIDDGLPGNSIHLCHADARGALWFGDTAGIAHVDPRPLRLPAPPAPRIRGVRIGGRPIPAAPLGETNVGPVVVPPGKPRIAIEYFAARPSAGSRPEFRTRLEGIDWEWSPPTSAREVEYARLAPGRYRFEVRTVEADLVESEGVASVDLVVLAPLWRRPWFVALCLALTATGAYAAYRARVARLLAVERLRTRIATDLHDEIGSSLSRVSILAEVTRREVEGRHPDAAARMLEIAESARGLVESMSDIVWSLDPRRDDLEHALQRLREYAADVLGSRGVAWTLSAPEGAAPVPLDAERRRHLYLILKEAIHNVAKHSQATSVAIRIAAGRGRIDAEVRDDGRGFDPATDTGGLATSSRRGTGLRSMRHRAAACGGTLDVESAPGRGTTVRLSIPTG